MAGQEYWIKCASTEQEMSFKLGRMASIPLQPENLWCNRLYAERRMWLNFVVDAFSAQYIGHAHHQFLPRDAMHSADYVVARCLSVCPSVCLSHAGILSKRLNISSNFLLSGSHTILVFPDQMVWQYSDEDPLTGASNAGV